jgi:hypothetical protein
LESCGQALAAAQLVAMGKAAGTRTHNPRIKRPQLPAAYPTRLNQQHEPPPPNPSSFDIRQDFSIRQSWWWAPITKSGEGLSMLVM